MAKTISQLIEHFRKYWKNILVQSFLAVIAIFIALSLLGMDRNVIVASIGATAFIVFVLPNKLTAQPRNVIGGHIIGALCGLVGAIVIEILPQTSYIWHDAIYALTVGLSILIHGLD